MMTQMTRIAATEPVYAPRSDEAAGYRLVTRDFDVRIEELEALDGPPDYTTVFPGGPEGYLAAHDEAIAYLEDLIADSLERLKELKDSRYINSLDLAPAHRA